MCLHRHPETFSPWKERKSFDDLLSATSLSRKIERKRDWNIFIALGFPTLTFVTECVISSCFLFISSEVNSDDMMSIKLKSLTLCSAHCDEFDLLENGMKMVIEELALQIALHRNDRVVRKISPHSDKEPNCASRQHSSSPTQLRILIKSKRIH